MSKHKKSRGRALIDPTPASSRQVPMTIAEDSLPALTGNEFLAPATIEPLFWRPRLLTDTPLLVHVPLLFWLCNVVRPRAVVTLGVGDGTGHFALCQALDKLNIAGRCEGYGFGQGASDTNTDLVPAVLRAHEARFYDGLSFLGGHGRAAADIQPGSLDLLVVDLDQSDSHDPQPDQWFAWLKPNGILILHGTGAAGHPGSGDAQAHTLTPYPRAVFRDGHGLTVLTQGGHLPHRLQTLLDLCENGVVPADIERIFRRLGQGLALLARDEAGAGRIGDLHREIAAEKAARAESEKLLADTQTVYDQRNHKLADLQTRLFETEQALIREQEKTASAAAEKVALCADYERRLAAAQQTRMQDTADQTRRIEDILSLRDRQAQQIAQLNAQLAGLRAKNKRMEKHIKELLNSTSWRITAPMRKIRTALKR